MSSPLLCVGEEEGQSNVTILASTGSTESVGQNSPEIKERNYLGLSDCSSVESSTVSAMSNGGKSKLNLKATELRLGLPGSLSPERDPELNKKPLFPLHPSMDCNLSLSHKSIVSGNKRGFSDAMNEFSERNFFPKSDESMVLSPRSFPIGSVKDNTAAPVTKMNETSSKLAQESPTAAIETNPNHMTSPNNNNSAPAPKAQVVGWPPIRSFRKNTLAITTKNTDEVDGKEGLGWPPIRSFRKNTLATTMKNTDEVDGKGCLGGLFVKVSMDGAPYLRKVDLKNYSAYQELSSSLEKMFSCFTIGKYGSHGAPGREMLSETKLKDLLHGSEYVLTYEDKDGDWMLVGDVPWDMFIGTCKRLRIMKSTDAIGLAAPRAVEKCGNRN